MAEYIEKTDTLNEGREKLNEGIKASERAEGKSDQAVSTAQQAVNTANTAETKADSVQQQFNNVVIEGDSSVEAAQARVKEDGSTFDTLRDRLNSSDSQLAQTETDLEGRGYNVLFPPPPLMGLKGDGTTDNTILWESFVQTVSEGSRVIFPKGTYLGNFVSEKTLDIDFQNSRLIALAPDLPNFRFEGNLSAPITVTGNPKYGETKVIVNDTTGLNVNDIVVIKDEAARPGDGKKDINQELLKIKNIYSVDGTVEFYDKIRGEFNTGTVTLTKVNTIKSPSIKNAYSKNNDSHLTVNFHFYACEDVSAENIDTDNSYGDGLRFEYVYGYKTSDLKFNNPRSIGSGQGYGLAVNFCREGFSQLVKGQGTRHTVDFSSSYNCKVVTVREQNGKGAVVVLAHNSFGGNIQVEDIECATDDYAVVALSQGLSEANKDIQIMRDYKVKNIKHTFPNKRPNEYAISVMFQHDYSDIEVDDVQTTFINDEVEPTLDSHVVRLEGNQAGKTSASNIKANSVGSLVYFGRRSATRAKPHPTDIINIEAVKCFHLAWLRGLVNSKVDGLFAEEIKSGAIRFDQRYAVYVETINLESTGLDKTLINNTLLDPLSNPLATGVLGKFPLLNARSYGAIEINNGARVTNDRLLTSNAMLRLQTPRGQSTTTLNATTPFDAPFWRGQPLTISINESGNYTSNRGDVVIPANSNTVANNEPITLKTGRTYNFVGYVGKWHLIS